MKSNYCIKRNTKKDQKICKQKLEKPFIERLIFY